MTPTREHASLNLLFPAHVAIITVNLSINPIQSLYPSSTNFLQDHEPQSDSPVQEHASTPAYTHVLESPPSCLQDYGPCLSSHHALSFFSAPLPHDRSGCARRGYIHPRPLSTRMPHAMASTHEHTQCSHHALSLSSVPLPQGRSGCARGGCVHPRPFFGRLPFLQMAMCPLVCMQQ